MRPIHNEASSALLRRTTAAGSGIQALAAIIIAVVPEIASRATRYATGECLSHIAVPDTWGSHTGRAKINIAGVELDAHVFGA